jgi:hypothetical protein
LRRCWAARCCCYCSKLLLLLSVLLHELLPGPLPWMDSEILLLLLLHYGLQQSMWCVGS